jgi:sucrose-6-phosphate hydrolase SacC (GH32 family)
VLLLNGAGASGQNPEDTVLKREIKIRKGQTYLNLPVKNSDLLVQATISLKDIPLERFTINLAVDEPDFWVFFDVTSYQGKSLTIEIAKAPVMFPGMGAANAAGNEYLKISGVRGLEKIYADTTFPGKEGLYKEPGRPQVHFSASRGWINDPNGLIYYKGLYHMFFQHNPYGWQWGNMHWGHATSRDLIHWEQWQEAIYPVMNLSPGNTRTGFGDAAFSGSAVIDPQNTAGFRKDDIDPIIAVYTSTGRGECLKMSYDEGRTFIDYPGNPILVHDGRDPRVFWYEPGNHWVMIVWDSGRPKKLSQGFEVSVRQHSIYTSPDLKTWTYRSGIQGFFECPELYQIAVEGEPGTMKWIMNDAHGRYIVGDFDGHQFSIEQDFTVYENGGGYFYASQTFSNIPDGRRIQVGWGRNITNPGMPFNQAQLIPSELKLRRTLNGYRLCPSPVRELASLASEPKVLTDKVIKSGEPAGLEVDTDNPLYIIAEIERGNCAIQFNILGFELRYDNEWIFSTVPPEGSGTESNEPAGPFPKPSVTTPVTYVSRSDIFKIEAVIDKNILEIYINDGELYYVTAFNGEKIPHVEASVPRGMMGPMAGQKNFYILKKLEVKKLNSIWPR